MNQASVTVRPKMGLRLALALLILAVLVPATVVEGIIYWNWYSSRLDSQLQQHLSMAEAAKTAFDALMTDVSRQEMEMGAGLARLPQGDVPALQEYLQANVKLYGGAVRSFHWANDQGQLTVSSDPRVQAAAPLDMTKLDYFPNLTNPTAKRDWVVSDLTRGWATGLPTIFVARRIFNTPGRLRGYLLASVEPTQLPFPKSAYDTGTYMLFDSRGRLVYGSDSVVTGPAGNDAWSTSDRLLRRVRQEQQAVVSASLVSPVNGEMYLSARVPSDQAPGYVIGADVRRAEVLSPIMHSLTLAVGLTLAAIAVSVAAAGLVGKRIIHGIESLQQQARRFGEGELQVVPRKYPLRELETLGLALDRMAQDLASSLSRLEQTNKELEQFAYSVSHDLRTPLRHISGFSQALVEDCAGQLDERGRQYLKRVLAGSQRMGQLIDDMLRLSRLTRQEMRPQRVDLTEMAAQVAGELRSAEPARRVEVIVQPDLVAWADPQLLHAALENLLANAWKFTSRLEEARIEVGGLEQDSRQVFFVRDNGAGFDMAHAEKLFVPFQRLHTESEFPGTGVGLATVQRIIHRHGGRIWAQAAVNAGATFFFCLGKDQQPTGKV